MAKSQRMIVFRGRVQQVPSGPQLSMFEGKQRLSREAAAIREVVARVHLYSVAAYNHTWHASEQSMKGQRQESTWIAGAIGKGSINPDADEWTGDRWEIGSGRVQNATEFLIYVPSRTLFIRHNPKVAQKPESVVARLEDLLNRTLSEQWPDSKWRFSLELERDTGTFLETFNTIETLETLSVRMFVPNGDGADLLRELQGRAGQAGAEKVNVSISSDRGIDKKSGFVEGALTLFKKGLAKLFIRGTIRSEETGAVTTREASSDQVARPVRHVLESDKEHLGAELADKTLTEVGPWKADEET